MRLCVKVIKFLFPRAEKSRMDYRFCLSYLAAHLEDLQRETRKFVKEDKQPTKGGL